MPISHNGARICASDRAQVNEAERVNGEANSASTKSKSHSEASPTEVEFSETHKIEYAKLRRAVHGGITKASIGRLTFDQRDDLAAETYLAIAAHAATGKNLTGELSSLAYRIAYNKTFDFFRARADALHHCQTGAAAELAYDTARDATETPEERILRLSGTARKAEILTASIEALSAAQKADLGASLSPRPAHHARAAHLGQPHRAAGKTRKGSPDMADQPA